MFKLWPMLLTFLNSFFSDYLLLLFSTLWFFCINFLQCLFRVSIFCDNDYYSSNSALAFFDFFTFFVYSYFFMSIILIGYLLEPKLSSLLVQMNSFISIFHPIILCLLFLPHFWVVGFFLEIFSFQSWFLDFIIIYKLINLGIQTWLFL